MSGNKKKLTRRDFLKGAAAAGAGLATVGALGAPSTTPVAAQVPTTPSTLPANWDREADIVIAGFGAAGAAAAMQATDKGAKVLVIEKQGTGGGATAYSGGIIYAAGTSVQKAQGITDSPEEMYAYDMAFGGDLADPDLLKVLSENSGPNIEWLIKEGWTGTVAVSGAEARPEYAAITPPKPRGHYTTGSGTGLFKLFKDACDRRGVEVLYNTKLTELVTSPTGEVLGVKAESGGNPLYIKGKKGVLLACGGFAANKEMLKTYSYDRGYRSWATAAPTVTNTPATSHTGYTGPASNTGDGINAALRIGAAVKGVSRVGGIPAIFKPGAENAYISVPGAKGVIFVNKAGKRFTKETDHYSIIFEDLAVNLPAYQIFDEPINQTGTLVALPSPSPTAPQWSADNSEEIAAGIIKKADTISDLANQVGIDPAGLQQTLDTYNANAEKGEDPEFGKAPAATIPIKTPPFYALEITPGMHGTTGGLAINTKAQVLNVNGEATPRLYASYETAGGFVGSRYPASGTAIASAICFGRIGGNNLVAEKPWA
jgi:flavocytochrome c